MAGFGCVEWFRHVVTALAPRCSGYSVTVNGPSIVRQRLTVLAWQSHWAQPQHPCMRYAHDMRHLVISLLGGFRATLDDMPVTRFRSARVQALLVFLILESQRAHSREALATLFWPDEPDTTAKQNLRQALYQLRQLLGEAAQPDSETPATSFLLISRDTVQFNPASDPILDVTDFEAHLAHKRYTNAIALYQGELLAALASSSEAFEEWLTVRRERLHMQMLDACTQLTTQALTRNDYANAQDYARRQLALEPWREQAHRQLMLALAASGERAAALAQYEICHRVLAAELGVQPDAATEDLLKQIRAGAIKRGEDEDMGRQVRPAPLIPSSPQPPHQDWGDAPDIANFYGRVAEQAQLTQWLDQDHCRLVTVIGMGGMGKTALAARLSKQIADQFEFVIWRSLVNAPPLASILQAWAKFFSGQQLIHWPADLDAQLTWIFEQLRRQRCLLVLDNVESIMQGGDRAGHYRPGYEDYGQLFKRLGESDHRSALLLTSREQPSECARLQADTPRVRSLALTGLDPAIGGELLTQRGLIGPRESTDALVTRYSGNPLALKLVAQTIRDVFNGDIHAFLSDETLIFDDIRDVLDQQFARLSPLERDILLWLAIERVPVVETRLWHRLSNSAPGPHVRRNFLEAVRSLQRRALLENNNGTFGLQNVVIEYLTDYLIAQAVHEFAKLAPSLLHSHAFILALVPEFVRESQRRVILQPIAEQLADIVSTKQVDVLAKQLLQAARDEQSARTSYLAGNVLNLLLQLGLDLTGYDFSDLSIWQAYLRGADLPQVNFTRANFAESVFTDYVGEVTCVAFSPDGKILAAGADNGVLYFWQVTDTNNFQLIGLCQGHQSQFGGLAFSPDGQWLVSGGDDQTVRIWEVRYRQLVHTMSGHSGGVTRVAFHPDGQTVASGSTDQTVRIWHAKTGELLHIFSEHGASPLNIILAVAFSPDGAILAASGHDQVVYIWDWSTKQPRRILRGHTGPIAILAFCPKRAEGNQTQRTVMASGSFDQTLRLWDVQTGELLAALEGHTAPILSTAFSADGALLMSGSDDQTVRMWDVSGITAGAEPPTQPEQMKQVLQGHFGTVTTLAVQPQRVNGPMLMVSGSNDKTLRVWDAHDGHPLATLSGHSKWLQAVIVTAEGRLLASGSDGRGLRIWDGRTGQTLHRLRGHTSRTEKLAFRADAAQLASAGWDKTARIWDVRRAQSLLILRGHTEPIVACVITQRAQGGNIAATGSLDHTVRLWDADSGNGIAQCHGHHDRVAALAFDPAGAILASGGWDCRIGLWDTRSGNLRRFLEGHTGPIETVAFHPNGQWLASGGWDKSVRVWDVESGQTIRVLQAHTNGLEMVTFSPDGRLLASCACDQLVCVWEVQTGRLLHTLRGHTRWVRCIAFSADSGLLASGSDDGSIKLWDVTAEGNGGCLLTTAMEDPYTGMNIAAATGINEGQRTALKALGALDVELL